MKKPSRKILILSGVIVLIIAGAAVFLTTRASGAAYAEETVKVRDLSTYYSFEGNIEADDSQLIYATAASTMKEIYVSEGDIVSKGDLLYELEGDNAQSKLTQAQATVASSKVSLRDAETTLARMTELFNAGAVSLADYEQAKSAYDVAEAQLIQAQANYDAARSDLDDLKGYAEVDGEVTDIYVEENDMMLSGTPIMDVINYSRLIVKIKIDEFDLDAVTEGQKASVLITALNKEVPGTVSNISKKAEVVNGVSYFNAEVVLDSDKALKVGLSAEAKIYSANAPDAVTISMEALQFDENNAPYVLTEDSNGKKISRFVTVGINDGSYAEIKEGLKSGDKVYFINGAEEESADPFLPPGAGKRMVNRTS